jgi:hypothetical protein
MLAKEQTAIKLLYHLVSTSRTIDRFFLSVY